MYSTQFYDEIGESSISFQQMVDFANLQTRRFDPNPLSQQELDKALCDPKRYYLYETHHFAVHNLRLSTVWLKRGIKEVKVSCHQ